MKEIHTTELHAKLLELKANVGTRYPALKKSFTQFLSFYTHLHALIGADGNLTYQTAKIEKYIDRCNRRAQSADDRLQLLRDIDTARGALLIQIEDLLHRIGECAVQEIAGPCAASANVD
jgi:hypothetical protein